MPVGKQVGKLSIRILPDSTKFRDDLKVMIKRVESTMRVRLNVEADTREAELHLARFRTAESKKSISFRVAASTLVAKAQLAVLARDRIVALSVRLNQASFTKASTALARLSGFRVAHNILTDVTDALKDLDLNIPKITRVALAIGTLSSMVLTSSAGLVTLAGDLAKIGNTGLLLPAIFASLTVGVLTLAMALKDSKTQLAVMGPALHELQNSISARFWEQAKKPIIDLFQSILPQLRKGFALTATALGRQAAAVSDAFKKSFAGGVLLDMFKKLGESMDIVTGGAGAFAGIITTLGTVGMSFMPRLAAWVVKISETFNDWLTRTAASGELQAFIEDGITQMKLFGSSIADTVRFLKGIDRAATAAGGGGLSSFAENMRGAAAIINSPKVQAALTTILVGARTAMDGFGGGLEKVGTMLTTISPHIATALSLAGEAIGGLVGAMADAMSKPGFRNGLVDMFVGMKAGVDALAPAMLPLADFVGELGRTIGVLAAQIGPLLAVIKETFAPLLDSILRGIQPLIPLIGGALVGAIGFLAPAVQVLGDIIDHTNGFLGGTVLAIAGLALVIKGVSFALMIAGWIANTAAMLVSKAETLFIMGLYAKDFVVAVGRLVASLALSTAAWVKNTAMMVLDKVQTLIIMGLYAKDFVVATAKVAAGLAVSTAGWIRNTAAQVISKGAILAGAVAMGIATAAQWAWNVAMSANPIALIIIAIAALVAGIIWFFTQTELGQTIWTEFTRFLSEAWTNISGYFTAAINFIVTAWSTFWDFIVLVASTYINIVVAVITAVLSVVVATWNAVWGGIAAIFGVIWSTIVAVVTGYINIVRTIIDTVLKVIVAIFTGNWGAIGGIVADAWNSIQGIVGGMVGAIRDAIGSIGSILGGIRNTVMGAISGAGAWLRDAGRSIIQGLIDGITGMIAKVRKAAGDVMKAIANFFPHSPAKEGPFSGRGWTLYSGQAMGDALATGMDSTVDRVRRAALAMTTAASVTGDVRVTDDTFGPRTPADGPSKQVNLTVNYPIAEPTSETVRRGSQLIGAALA